MRALDLFCCIGGAGMGLHRAGFHVTGIDINDHSDFYPFAFIQQDAMTLDVDFIRTFDLVWASPPCQAYTAFRRMPWLQGEEYPDLVDATRAMLNAAGVPYIIENVPGAPIRCDVLLCGTHFNLRVNRHRWFELGGWWTMAPGCVARTCKEVRAMTDATRATRATQEREDRGYTTADQLASRKSDYRPGIVISENSRNVIHALHPHPRTWKQSLCGHECNYTLEGFFDPGDIYSCEKCSVIVENA